MKKILIITILILLNNLSADVVYECSNTKLTKDGETNITSKKPTIVVSTNWMQKPTMVKIYLRDRSKDIYDKVQFQAINKQSTQEWLKGPTVFYGAKDSQLTIYDKGSYFLVKTKMSNSLYAENECVKK